MQQLQETEKLVREEIPGSRRREWGQGDQKEKLFMCPEGRCWDHGAFRSAPPPCGQGGPGPGVGAGIKVG